MTNVTLQQLLAAGVHFGHKVSRWNPKMLPYIHEEKNDIHILDLVKSLQSLEKANSFCKKSASEGKTFLFVGTKPYIRPLIAKEAERSNSLYVNQRWLGGMLTNWITLKNRITDLKNLENQQKIHNFDLLPKKEAAILRQKLIKLKTYLNGVKEMRQLPDVVIIIDQESEITAIKECKTLGIPIISIIDTNSNPDLIDLPIPGNDDSISSIKLILKSLTDNICLGKQTK
mgnify:CR=1 FL=1